METHKQAVAAISDQIRKFYGLKQPYRIYHGSSNSTRPSAVRRNQMVDTSKLTNVLEVDPVKQTALVEPNVPMDALVGASLKHNLVPQVVMEFPGITVGGGFAGTSGESSSFKFGLFECTVNRIEIVVPNGDIMNASSTEYPDLFQAAAGSFGTMGVTTLLEVQLIPAKKYVELTYHPVGSMDEAVDLLETKTTLPSTDDFVEGIMFSTTQGVIITGRFTDEKSKHMQTFTGPWDPWFYLFIQDKLKKSSLTADTVPTADYLFRYDRGAFWAGMYAFKYFKVPFNFITRRILDYFMHTRVIYRALIPSGHANRYIVQDVAFPYSTAAEFVKYVNEDFGLYPLWLCPVRRVQPGLLIPKITVPTRSPDLYLNIGVWGPGSLDHKEFVASNRRLERKLHELGGVKCLYAHAYYTEEEFWDVYDKDTYDQVRTKYHADWLPNIPQKVVVNEEAARKIVSGIWSVWPVAGVYGALKAIGFRRHLRSLGIMSSEKED